MGPTVQSVSTIAPTDNQTSASGSHTVAGGLTDSVMIVMINSPQFAEATSANWNGTSMTKLSIGSSSNYWCSAYYLLDPEAGTYNVGVGWSVIEREAVITALTIDNSGIPVYLGEDNNFTGNPSFTGNTTEDDALVVEFIMSQVTTHAPSGSETERSDLTSNTGNYRHSTESLAVATAGSMTIGVTFGANKTYQMKVLQFSARVSAATGNFFNFY